MQNLNLDTYQKLASRTAADPSVLENFILSLVDTNKIYETVLSHYNLHSTNSVEFVEDIARNVAKQLSPHWAIMIASLGLVGEAGEFAEIIKKTYGHGHPLSQEKLKNELGDVQWYLAENARVNNLSLDEVGRSNLEKLLVRYPDKFSATRSLERVDVPSE